MPQNGIHNMHRLSRLLVFYKCKKRIYVNPILVDYANRRHKRRLFSTFCCPVNTLLRTETGFYTHKELHTNLGYVCRDAREVSRQSDHSTPCSASTNCAVSHDYGCYSILLWHSKNKSVKSAC